MPICFCSSIIQFPDDNFDESESTEETEFYLHKRNYYMKKMGYPEMTP